MKITFCCTGNKPEPWLAGLHSALPGAEVTVWEPGAPPADHAVVWAPPQQFFDEQTRLKGVFNIGAGVDALLRLRLPPNAMVVRLDDAGMSVQMAEYVCHGVIRHFREFDGYAADIQAGQWSYRKPRERSEFPVGVMGLGVLGARVAQSVAQFDFPVVGWSRSAKDLTGVRCYAGAAQFNDFLASTRILVNLLPLTSETRDIMRLETLSRLQRGGYVINVARGAHLVDDDLLALLASSGGSRKSPSRRTPRRAPCATRASPRSPARSARSKQGRRSWALLTRCVGIEPGRRSQVDFEID